MRAPRTDLRRVLTGILMLAVPTWALAADPLPRLKVPPGFEVSVYAEVEGPRQLALGPEGLLFVGGKGGEVRVLLDRDEDGDIDEIGVVARDLDAPAGVAWRDGDLYVAETTRILRFRGLTHALASAPPPEVLLEGLPRSRGHALKYLAFGGDGALYFGVGVPCNICEPPSPHGEILRLDPATGVATSWARGIRNSVGLLAHPRTGDLWFTDNGRDWLGDELPSCELNRAGRAGLHFGFPWRHGLAVTDPEYGPRTPPDLAFTPPVLELGAHVAPLGLAYHPGQGMPEAYRGNLFIAEHGSWNRSRKSGYRVVRVALDESGREVRHHAVFMEGWLEGEEAWGRPVDVEILRDGSLLVADDGADRIYRVRHVGP